MMDYNVLVDFVEGLSVLGEGFGVFWSGSFPAGTVNYTDRAEAFLEIAGLAFEFGFGDFFAGGIGWRLGWGRAAT